MKGTSLHPKNITPPSLLHLCQYTGHFCPSISLSFDRVRRPTKLQETQGKMQANIASSAKHISFRIVLAASVCSATDRKKGACKALWQAVCIEGSLALIRHSHFNYALVISLCRGEDVMLTQPSHCSQMGRLSVSVPKKRGHLACRSEF